MTTRHSPNTADAASTGFERGLLRRLPAVLAGSALIAGLPSALTRLLAWAGVGGDATAAITTADIFGLSLLLLTWTTAFTLAIAAVILLVMKGPAHFADSYPLDDAERPDPPAQG